MSKGKGSKDNQVFSALRMLMAKPGNLGELWADIIPITTPGPHSELVRALASPNYTDMAAALVYGAMVEQALEQAITTHFEDPADKLSVFAFGDEGPLSNYASKIAMGHALGIYDDRLRHNLRWVQRIRNAFAHARSKIDFDTAEIAAACDRLTSPVPQFEPVYKSRITSAMRLRFSWNAAMAAGYLMQPGNPRLLFKGSQSYEMMFPPPASPETPPTPESPGPSG